MNNLIDLHMHSFYSDDGQFSEEELVKKSLEAKLTIMAISDHNCAKANKKAVLEAEKYGIKYIPAIEIDCTYQDINLHVLGYGIDYENEIFNDLYDNIINQQLANGIKALELTNDLGFELTREQMDKITNGKPYIGEAFAEALLNDERYMDNEILKPYREGGSRSDNPYVNFYWDYYAQGKPAYTKVVYPSLKETIDLIHSNNGKAILAHPGNNLKGRFEVFEELVEQGLDGVEVFSSYHSQETIDYFYKKAKELNLFFTCGSDYHGKTKPSVFLGKTECINQNEIIENLKKMELI